MTEHILTAEKVTAIFTHCLYKAEELPEDGSTPSDAVIVRGIMRDYGFHPVRLSEKKDEIVQLLKELPEEFMKSAGGGMSFLNACVDRSGHQWAEHPTMEVLFVLGMAINAAGYCFPREIWADLPGSVPYLFVDDLAA